MGSLQKRLFFESQVTTKTKNLLNLLVTLNIIRRFYKVNLNLYRIFPSYNKHRKHSRPTKIYTKLRGRIRLSIRTLRILQISTPHTYYILETSSGLMTHKTAVQLGIGGLLLMVIY